MKRRELLIVGSLIFITWVAAFWVGYYYANSEESPIPEGKALVEVRVDPDFNGEVFLVTPEGEEINLRTDEKVFIREDNAEDNYVRMEGKASLLIIAVTCSDGYIRWITIEGDNSHSITTVGVTALTIYDRD